MYVLGMMKSKDLVVSSDSSDDESFNAETGGTLCLSLVLLILLVFVYALLPPPGGKISQLMLPERKSSVCIHRWDRERKGRGRDRGRKGET